MTLTRLTGHEGKTWVECYLVPSQSDPSKEYVTSKKNDGTWGCSCPGWIFHGHRECKHIRLVQTALATTTRIIPTKSIEQVSEKVRQVLSRFALIETE